MGSIVDNMYYDYAIERSDDVICSIKTTSQKKKETKSMEEMVNMVNIKVILVVNIINKENENVSTIVVYVGINNPTKLYISVTDNDILHRLKSLFSNDPISSVYQSD